MGDRKCTPRIVQILEGYAAFNPHLRLTGEAPEYDAREVYLPSRPGFKKWSASDPTPAHWYQSEQFHGLLRASISANPDRTLRAFVGETFRGFARTPVQKELIDLLGLRRARLRDFIRGDDIDSALSLRLWAGMCSMSQPVAPEQLGVLGKRHFEHVTARAGEVWHFKYASAKEPHDSRPYVVEVAFASYADDRARRIHYGINFAPVLGNPFQMLAKEMGRTYSLDSFLADKCHLEDTDPVTIYVHLTTPHLRYTNRGKSSLETI